MHKRLSELEQRKFQKLHKRARRYQLYLILQDIADEREVRQCFDLAYAYGVERIYLVGSTAIPRGNQRLYFRPVKDAGRILNTLRAQEFAIVAPNLEPSAINIYDLETALLRDKRNICLVMGPNAYNVSNKVLESSNFTFFLPLQRTRGAVPTIGALAVALSWI